MGDVGEFEVRYQKPEFFFVSSEKVRMVFFRE
jgi:hypothetical protein